MRTMDILFTAVPVETPSRRSGLIEVAAAAIAKALPTGWSQETIESPDGEASLVIMSLDDNAATFLVTGHGAGYQLDMLQDDELWLLGECNSVGHLAWLLDTRIRLEHSVSQRAA